MSVVSALSAVAEAVSSWLDPERKERRVLRAAIEAGEELMKVLRKEGRYKGMSEARRISIEAHYQKRWDAWKDGKA